MRLLLSKELKGNSAGTVEEKGMSSDSFSGGCVHGVRLHER